MIDFFEFLELFSESNLEDLELMDNCERNPIFYASIMQELGIITSLN